MTQPGRVTPSMKVSRALLAIAVLFFGPLLGIVVALILGGLALPPDPNFAANGGHAAPGDGFVILPYLFFSLLVSVPLSILLAGGILFYKPKAQNQVETP
jgi:hypothetical protein